MKPTFTILVGSKGRYELKEMLRSIHRQNRVEGDQCLVGIDALGMEEQAVLGNVNLVRSFGPDFQAVPYIGINDDGMPFHWLGVEQINNLLRTVPITGSHVFTIGDDDVFVDGAYDVIRRVCEQYPLRPIIYRFVAPNRWVLWDAPRMSPCLISGCCIAAPYAWVGLMHKRLETTHDFDWMMDIIRKAQQHGFEPVYLDYVGVIARPGLDTPYSKYAYEPKVVEACDPSTPNAYQ